MADLFIGFQWKVFFLGRLMAQFLQIKCLLMPLVHMVLVLYLGSTGAMGNRLLIGNTRILQF